MGLVNQVVDDGDFEKAVMQYALRYQRLSRSAVSLTKKLLYAIDGDDFRAAIRKGAEINAEARMTEDCKAGIAKFLSK